MPGIIAEGAMMAPALWKTSPRMIAPNGAVHGGAVLGIDATGLAARLSIHPEDIARAALALCLGAETAVIDAMRQETDP